MFTYAKWQCWNRSATNFGATVCCSSVPQKWDMCYCGRELKQYSSGCLKKGFGHTFFGRGLGVGGQKPSFPLRYPVKAVLKSAMHGPLSKSGATLFSFLLLILSPTTNHVIHSSVAREKAKAQSVHGKCCTWAWSRLKGQGNFLSLSLYSYCSSVLYKLIQFYNMSNVRKKLQ